MDFEGNPTAFCGRPEENIAYVSCHDAMTLFDITIVKPPRELGLAERLRMVNLAAGMIALSQGVPFFHAGDEILRSKSLDRDSYSSGDWFNRVDWSM